MTAPVCDITPVRNAIVAKLQGIADIGRVHGFERYAADMDALRGHYVASIAGADQLRGWYVRRVAGGETSPVDGRYIETATWKIQGFMALDDDAASEIQFDLLVDAVRDAFRADATIGGAVVFTAFGQAAGAQLKDAGPVMFAGVLCHAATLTLTTTRYFQGV